MNPSNENSSPLHLSSVLNNLSLDVNSPQHELTNSTYLLKLSNLPNDITLREVYTIFALANNIKNIELIENKSNNDEETKPMIIATFDLLEPVIRYAQTLASKTDLFGPKDPTVCQVEVIDNTTQKIISFQNMQTNLGGSSQFNSQIPSLLKMNPMLGSNQLPQQPSLSNNGANLGSSRSKFSFSDPFANNMSHKESLQQTQPSNVNQSHPDLSVNTTDVGKSFLLMDNDEINDTIWGPNAIPSSINGLSNTPQPSTPNLEWGNSNSRKQSSAFFLPTTSGSVSTPSMPNMDVNAMSLAKGVQLPNNATNSSSIPSNTSATSIQPYGLMNKINSNNSQGINNMMDTNDMNYPTPQKQPQGNFNTNSPYKNRMNLSSSRNLNDNLVSNEQTTNDTNNLNTSSTNIASTSTNNSTRTISSTKATSSTPVSKGNTVQATMSQADLSLLARVPPPANPADQNPPCNTLYVGNLPPDATEAELRQLFSSQHGFRRLSFRNKNNNGHGHGPMCFVEFDDVSFATRALAELYGSQLPRSTISNKGGIRLSFSKNPLGVRGPNSRRNVNSNSSSNITSTTTSGTTNNNSNLMSLNSNSNGSSNNVSYSFTNTYSRN